MNFLSSIKKKPHGGKYENSDKVPSVLVSHGLIGFMRRGSSCADMEIGSSSHVSPGKRMSKSNSETGFTSLKSTGSTSFPTKLIDAVPFMRKKSNDPRPFSSHMVGSSTEEVSISDTPKRSSAPELDRKEEDKGHDAKKRSTLPQNDAKRVSMAFERAKCRSAGKRLSRRKRNTTVRSDTSGGSKGFGFLQLCKAALVPAESSMKLLADSVSPVLIGSLTKVHLCDVLLVGCDESLVRAPSYLLACSSTVFEELLYPKVTADAPKSDHSLVAATAKYSPANPREIKVPFAGKEAIRALVHFCASHDLPDEMETATSEENVRSVHQCHVISKVFCLKLLEDATDRALRRLMNKKPTLLCAAYDENVVSSAELEATSGWGFKVGGTSVKRNPDDDLHHYMLEYMRESPLSTLLDGGVEMLSALSIETVVRDQFIDVDEQTMFHILKTWVDCATTLEEEEKLKIGKSLMSHISLSLMEPDYLKLQVKNSRIVDLKDVENALEEIEAAVANESIEDKERVIVEGAGDTRINGIYVLMAGDIGLGDEEIIYVKEGDGDGICPDIGLYLWGGMWAISSCIDYSNILYSCRTVKTNTSFNSSSSIHLHPPKWGWEPSGAKGPPPICTWKSGRVSDKRSKSEDIGLAPRLDVMTREGGKEMRSIKSDVSNGDHAERRMLSLDDMMSLPVDDDFDYSGMDSSTHALDLDGMLSLPCDPCHEQEEAGYEVRHPSLFRYNATSDHSFFKSAGAKNETPV